MLPLALSLVAAIAIADSPAVPASVETPPIVVLSGTGQTDQGLPVLAVHPDSARIGRVLERGFSGRWLRLYRAIEHWRAARDNRRPEPAYLFLSTNQGGFARSGFVLDTTRKPNTPYVDLHKDKRLSGEFAAIDQIFPHELAHIMLRQLTGEPPSGHANQVHAIGVRTDPETALNEGFADHAQVMAIDDPEAEPATRALAMDADARRFAHRWIAAYRRSLEARWAPAPPARMAFPLWFSRTEQILRYHAVKADAFSRRVEIPDRLYTPHDPWGAYLLENIVPGDDDNTWKSSAQRASTEGAVSAFIVRWMTDAEFQTRKAAPPVYEQFGVDQQKIANLENAYLKLFYALAQAPAHDIRGVVHAYAKTFPEEGESIKRLLELTRWPDLLGERPPELWLKSASFQTGTTMFDQFRAARRAHTFDLNSATRSDLSTVDGMTPAIARRLLEHAPYASLHEVRDVAGISPEVTASLERMAALATKRYANDGEGGAHLNLSTIMLPFVFRALWAVGACAAAGTLLTWLIRRRSITRAALTGGAAAIVGLLPAWVSGEPLFALGAPMAVAVAAALWSLTRSGPRQAARVLAGWFAAALPGWFAVQTWF